MTHVTMEDVQALIALFDDGDWDEFHITLDGFELHLNKDAKAARTWGGAEFKRSEAQPSTAALAASVPKDSASPASTDYEVPEGMTVLRAPNLGTFYRSPKPGTPPYVEIGQKVEADAEVCLIEVMKLFTPVKAGVAGTIREILVADAELVEFDQPLFVIEPHA